MCVPAVVAKQTKLMCQHQKNAGRPTDRPFLPAFSPFFVPLGLPGFRFAGSGVRIGLSSGFIATEMGAAIGLAELGT